MFGKQKYPRWDYDRKLGLGYLRLESSVKNMRVLARTRSVCAENVTLLIDYDTAGNIVGVEVIG